ncbi:serpin family protein [Thermoanaerobacter kivui]
MDITDVIKKVQKLDRPFVYAIIDNKTNLPIFIGTVMSIKN